MQIGVVGIGRMGSALADRLIQQGYQPFLYDLNPSRSRKIQGGIPVAHLEAVAESEIVMLSLPDSPQVKEVVLSEGGLLHLRGSIEGILDFSTINPEIEKEIYLHAINLEISYADAPVSGGVEGARKGTLAILFGGDEAFFKKVCPLLEILGKPSYVGRIGSGQAIKAGSQIFGALAAYGIAEALSLADAYGIDHGLMVEQIKRTSSATSALDTHGPNIVSGNFAEGFPVSLWEKDLRIAGEILHQAGHQGRGVALVRRCLQELIERGEGSLNAAALYINM